MRASTTDRKRGNWRSLSLRTLILLITLLGVTCGLVGRRIHTQRNQSRAVNQLHEIAAESAGSVNVNFEDPWRESRFRWMRGRFPRATELDMRYSGANARDYADAFSGLPFLKRLYLRDCEVTDEVVDTLSNCRDLRRLELKNNSGITDTSAKYLMRLQKLNALNVKQTQMTWQAFSQLATLPEMSELSCNHTFSNANLAELGDIGRVRFTQLNCNAIDANGLSHLTELEDLDNVRSLAFRGSRITPEWQPIFEQLDSLNRKRLDLIGCSYAPGIFDTYHLPHGKGRINITTSQSEFDTIVAGIRSAQCLQVNEPTKIVIKEPNGLNQNVCFRIVASPTSLNANSDGGLESETQFPTKPVSMAALRSIQHTEELLVSWPDLFEQFEPELIAAASRLTLRDTGLQGDSTSFMTSLNKVSLAHPMATEELSIWSPQLPDTNFEVIARMTNLKSLVVQSPKAQDGTGYATLAPLKKLARLHISHDYLGPVDQLVEQLRPLEHLKTISGPAYWPASKRKELAKKLGVVWDP